MKTVRKPFGALSLDRVNECAYQGERPLRLTPKAFAVLCELVERAGRLVTKDELLSAVWADTIVTEASLSTCVREIRRALGDRPTKPRYIETVHRRGYRCIRAAVATTRAVGGSGPKLSSDTLVGRDSDLASLARSLWNVRRGERHLVLLAGEAGIGKTTLLEHFLADTKVSAHARISRGQCIEQYGASEPYLPWIEVLNHFAADYGKERLVDLLRRCAPMWLVQLPWLIEAAERKDLQREIAGFTRERMVRELAETLEALAAENPVIVVLEDLHWSDPSSIGLLAYLAQRRQRSRLLLIGTYRPMELQVNSHPLMTLKQDLLAHGLCEERQLEFLTREAVAEYLEATFPDAPADLAVQVHRRTDGNPLFMVNVIDDLLARGTLVHKDGQWQMKGDAQGPDLGVPDSLKKMVERQLDRLLQEDRRILEAASVAGIAFSGASVAAILEETVESTEERLRVLARRGSFVKPADRQVWPDGTQSDGYSFIHVLYQNVLYERIGAARRIRTHRLAGGRLEAAYGLRAGEVAAELALHFQRGHDSKRAVSYLAQAGENAVRRSAYVEAITLLNAGNELLATLSQGPDRDQFELQLLVPLGMSYINSRGYAAPEVGNTFQRAHKLARNTANAGQHYRALRGLWFFFQQRAQLRKAQSVAEDLLRFAQCQSDQAGLVEGYRILATTSFHVGKFPRSLQYVQQGLALYDAKCHSSHVFLDGQDPGVCSLVWQGWLEWYLGRPDQALVSTMQGVELARRIEHPFSLSYALNFAARLHICRREPEESERYASESLRCAEEYGLTPMLAIGQILHGWSAAFLGDSEAAIPELEEGVARWRSTGARLITPYWMYLLASALDKVGRTEAALSVLDDALTEAQGTEERWFDCDLYLLKAAIMAQPEQPNKRGVPLAEVRRYLRRALRAATEMGSPSLRLRAANALSHSLRDQGKAREAEDLLRKAHGVFAEGFQTADLADARMLLAEF
jgi:DNA-binding winged helix-turn-helix (wHTH) protein/tetratricopeptide (TPR) repeat protein